MQSNSILYTLFSGTPMFVCAFWFIILMVHQKNKHQSMQILRFFMFTATCLYFGHFVVFNHLNSLIPVTDTIYSLATLSVYPIYFLYIVSLTGKVRPAQWFILLPGILIAAVIGICYLLMSEDVLGKFIQSCLYEKGNHPESTLGMVSVNAHELMKPVILIQVITVLYFGFRRLICFKSKVEQYFSNTERRDLRGIRNLLLAFVVTSFLSATADIVGRAFFVDSMVLMLLVLIPFSIMLFCIGLVGYHQVFTIDDLEKEIVEDKVDSKIKIQDSKVALKKKIDLLMKEEKLYLQPDLKLSDVALLLHTNRTYVYEALKNADNEQALSFTDYVNQYRITYSIDLLKNNHEKESIEAIIFQSGFASKTNFYKNFKKFTGKTPKGFLRQLNN